MKIFLKGRTSASIGGQLLKPGANEFPDEKSGELAGFIKLGVIEVAEKAPKASPEKSKKKRKSEDQEG